MPSSNFQIIVLGICVTLILAGVGVFAAFGGAFGHSSLGSVTIWGTEDQEVMQNLIENLQANDKSLSSVTYIQKNPATYDTDLVNAMANGTAPDLFIVGDDEVSSFSDKIITIPYSYMSQSSFLSSFVDEGQLFLTSQGALALPFTIDPLVMYWNNDLFAGAGLANPPLYWNDFFSLAPKITSLDSSSNVRRSAVALGEWKNIAHAKEILSALFMQAGDSIVVRGQDGGLSAVFGSTPSNFTENPAQSALNFYTEFANPSKTSYSWNRSLPEAANAFAAGDLAVYFGYASEYASFASRNPNLHYSAAVLPQIQGNPTRLTFGRMTALAIPRSARNVKGAALVALKLTAHDPSASLAAATNLPSVRRDVSLNTSSSAALQVFAQSALIARSWLDPNPAATDSLFENMIESVVSGKNTPASAVGDASQELEQLTGH